MPNEYPRIKLEGKIFEIFYLAHYMIIISNFMWMDILQDDAFLLGKSIRGIKCALSSVSENHDSRSYQF